MRLRCGVAERKKRDKVLRIKAGNVSEALVQNLPAGNPEGICKVRSWSQKYGRI
jgi:hypothetical protein